MASPRFRAACSFVPEGTVKLKPLKEKPTKKVWVDRVEGKAFDEGTLLTLLDLEGDWEFSLVDYLDQNGAVMGAYVLPKGYAHGFLFTWPPEEKETEQP